MQNDQTDLAMRPLTGRDLERWRTMNGLSKAAAADAFGLQKTKWEELIRPDAADKTLQDPLISMLLALYTTEPDSQPIKPPPDIRDFYTFLGLGDSSQDRQLFATVTGRSTPSVYRLLQQDGKPSRPVLRWIEAVLRMNLNPKQSLAVMTRIATRVQDRNTLKPDKRIKNE